VDELRGFQGSQERFGQPFVHGNLLPASFDGVEGILDPLLEWNVPRNNGDRLDPDFRIFECHHERNRVIGCRVGVD